jgi:hypothetical protein
MVYQSNRKNLITAEDNIIKKEFCEKIDYYTEYYFYCEFLDFKYIALLKDFAPQHLCLSQIHGKSLYQTDMQCQILLAETLASFHNMTYSQETGMALLHFDTNLKNYIYSHDMIYMVDFSDITLGSPLIDIYSVLLFFCELHRYEDFLWFYPKFWDRYTRYANFCVCHDREMLQTEIQRFESRRKNHGKSIHDSDKFSKNLSQLYNHCSM